VLHIAAVVFLDIVVLGAVVNPSYGMFDKDGKFVAITLSQVILFMVGCGVTQLLSMCLMVLNQVEDVNVTRKYLGMAISVAIVASCASVTTALTLSYPRKYSLAWTIAFGIVLLLEVVVFQSIWWFVNCRVFRNKRILELSISSRSIRVFTTES
jgi:predicted permease